MNRNAAIETMPPAPRALPKKKIALFVAAVVALTAYAGVKGGIQLGKVNRDKNAERDLKVLVMAMESYRRAHQAYPAEVAQLAEFDYRPIEEVDITVTPREGGFIATETHRKGSGRVFIYDSEKGFKK